MSVEKSTVDLNQVRAQFEAWRSAKTSVHQRIPAHLWSAAIKLLDYYPVGEVCRELHLSAQDLYKHRDRISTQPLPGTQPRRNRGQFLELTGHPLITANNSAHQDGLSPAPPPDPSALCQLVLEKKDGHRLTISLPLVWPRLETLCLNLLRTER